MLAYLSVTGIFLSILLLVFNVRKNTATIYLGLFFLLVSLYGFSQYVLLYSKSVFLISLFTSTFTFLFYLVGPLLYWYVRSVLKDNANLKKSDLVHLLPMIVFLVAILPYMLSSWDYKTDIAQQIVNNRSFLLQYKFTFLSDLLTIHGAYLSRPLLVLGYTLWSVWLFIRFIRHHRMDSIFQGQRFMLPWMIIFLSFQMTLIVTHLIMMLKPFSVFITISFLQVVSWLGLLGLLISPFFFPHILYGLPRLPRNDAFPVHEPNGKQVAEEKHGRVILNFESDYLQDIDRRVHSCMKEMRPYLNTEFNLAHLSVMINVPIHHLAYFFREKKKQSFNDYRNHWRVTHAKKLIKEGKAVGLTLEAIGLSSGFSTRNTFFTAFKREEGLSPGAYASQYIS